MPAIQSSTPPIEFRDIPGFPGYRIGNDGSVWSCHLPGMRGRGGRCGDSWRPLSRRSKGQYPAIAMRPESGGKAVMLKVHRLVLETFVGPCPEGMECCHYDGDRTNNRLENLRWDTRTANVADMIRHGRMVRAGLPGSKNPYAKLTEADIPVVRHLVRSGCMQKDIARRFGVSRTIICAIIKGKAWSHVSG